MGSGEVAGEERVERVCLVVMRRDGEINRGVGGEER